jgi:hypothetical protein
MSVRSYGEFPSQQSSNKVHPSKGISQFKTPLRRQSDTLLEQGQRSSTQGSTPSRSISQFKAPLLQTGTLRAQNQSYAAFGAPSSNSASHETNPSQPFIPQPEKWREQSGYRSPSGMHLSNAALHHSGPTMSLPRVMTLPSVAARDTYSAGNPIAQKSSVLTIYPNNISTNPYIGIPAPHSSLAAHRQGQSPQFLRESDLPRTEPLAGSETRLKTKTQVTMRVIIMVGTGLLVGGIASFWLLRFPTFLIVAWAILIIVLSNLVSRELRSYYQLKSTMLRMETEHSSTISTSHDVDMERDPMLKDISDTTGYLKALCFVFKPDQPAQNFPPEKEYRV